MNTIKEYLIMFAVWDIMCESLYGKPYINININPYYYKMKGGKRRR